MILTAEQERALKSVTQWHRSASGQDFFYLAGFAGTGKTTLARHFAEGVGGEVLYGAFTGKAASVMRSKGCTDATTIHRLIYQPTSKGTARLRKLQDEMKDLLAKPQASPFDLVAMLRREIIAEIAKVKSPGFLLNPDSDVLGASLVIIDECSMVDQQMAADLLSFETPVLVLGDPAQLPPVKGKGYFTAGRPDVMLEEIHRQARESGILRMATEIRQGKVPAIGTDYGDARVIAKADIDPSTMPDYDQILVGRNGTRRAINKRIRELLGYDGDMPVPSDRIVCLRNNHDLGLLNGGLWTVIYAACADDVVSMQIMNEDDEPFAVNAWSCLFEGKDLDQFDHSNDTQEFDYSYALTVHKAQGSEFPRVVLFDESHRFPMSQNPLPWIYTGATRASEELLFVR